MDNIEGLAENKSVDMDEINFRLLTNVRAFFFFSHCCILFLLVVLLLSILIDFLNVCVCVFVCCCYSSSVGDRNAIH